MRRSSTRNRAGQRRRDNERWRTDPAYRARRTASHRKWARKNAAYVKAYNQQYGKTYRQKNKSKLSFQKWERRLWKEYGLTVETHLALWRRQKGRCAICRRAGPLVIDHCHRTRKVRGLLCDDCNVGLGRFKDRRRIVAAAVKYLGDNV